MEEHDLIYVLKESHLLPYGGKWRVGYKIEGEGERRKRSCTSYKSWTSSPCFLWSEKFFCILKTYISLLGQIELVSMNCNQICP